MFLATRIARRAVWYKDPPVKVSPAQKMCVTNLLEVLRTSSTIVEISYAQSLWEKKWPEYCKTIKASPLYSEGDNGPALADLVAREYAGCLAPPFPTYILDAECMVAVPDPGGGGILDRPGRKAYFVKALEYSELSKLALAEEDPVCVAQGLNLLPELAQYRWLLVVTEVEWSDHDIRMRVHAPCPQTYFTLGVTAEGRPERIRVNRSSDGNPEENGNHFVASIGPFLEAHRLMHHKNVGLGVRKFSEGDTKAYAKLGKPSSEIRYHVLELRTKEGTTELRPGISGEREEAALHTVRGHYKVYTQANPLFGKLTGIFWVASHMRGNPERGEIKKDYKLVPPVEGGSLPNSST